MPKIGVSFPVPDPWGSQLQDFRVRLGDHAARLIPTHITLLPPYDVAAEQLDEVHEHLSRCAAAAVSVHLRLRGTGTFRPVSPVVFVNVVAGISQCELLAAAVQSGPLDVERRFQYHPHVTVAHDVEPNLLDRAFDELADFDAAFEAREMCLYHHHPDTGWEPRESFGLGALTDSGRTS